MSGDTKKFHVLQKGRAWFVRENDKEPAPDVLGQKKEKYWRSFDSKAKADAYIDRVLANYKFAERLETPPSK